MKKVTVAVVGMLIAAAPAFAAKPVNVSLVPDVALYNRHEQIDGLVVGLWNENPQRALALGLVNGSTGRSAGLSWAFLLNYADDYTGIQWAPVNYTRGQFEGWQGGIVNYTRGTMKGLQTGMVNVAGRLTGLQLGLLNYAKTAETGVQLGLINLIPSNEWFTALPHELAPGMPFVNWRF